MENTAVAVEESSVLDVKSGTALIISSGRVLVFNCYLRVTVCKYRPKSTFCGTTSKFE